MDYFRKAFMFGGEPRFMMVRHSTFVPMKDSSKEALCRIDSVLPPKENKVITEDTGIMLAMYEEQRTMCRHHAGQRGTATNLIVTVSAVILGLITLDHKITIADLPLTGFLVFVGLYGALLSAKHYERFAMYKSLCRALEQRLDHLLPTVQLGALINKVELQHKLDWPRLNKLKIFWLWTGVHIAIAGLGVIVSIFAILSKVGWVEWP